MQRVDPVFPDLFPLTHRLGGVPAPEARPVLDPVCMRVHWEAEPARPRPTDHSLPRRPVRLLLHARTARDHATAVGELTAAGCGIVLLLEDEIAPAEVPAPVFGGQLLALAVWLPTLFGGCGLPDLGPWRHHGAETGVLLGLGPERDVAAAATGAVAEACDAGARFVVAAPLALPAEDRHRVYDAHAGEAGDGELEDLLFHTDLTRLALALERATSRACQWRAVAEGLPGPACGVTDSRTAWAAGQLLMWARRLDLLDEISSSGWQLRRAARALMAAGRSPMELTAEDNLRVIPGFTPWVEAFARGVWGGGGEPFEGVRARWLAG